MQLETKRNIISNFTDQTC